MSCVERQVPATTSGHSHLQQHSFAAAHSSIYLSRRRLRLALRPKTAKAPKFTCFAAATASRPAAPKEGKGSKEAHKIFDEVVITVRSGRGGRGEMVEAGAGKRVPNFKYRARSSLPKQIWLPAADPADGSDGASVLLYADPALDNLLHLHDRKTIAAKHGANGNPVEGSAGSRRQGKQPAPRTQPLRVGVPMGTVVMRKRGGALLGELTNPGETLLVARGGKGGLGVVRPAAQQSGQGRRKFLDEGEGVLADDNWAVDAEGGPGEEVSLQLLMRVVADIGIVGLPNAGKSSLLAVLTRASPEVAPYPFTTLMPNLGVMAAGQPAAARDEFELEHWEAAAAEEAAPVLADLPGLIEGAHAGRGLGRNFLRHLRRTRGILHVVDASAADPAADYEIVRQELAMYNPAYCGRPHVVALNKMDLEDAAELHREAAQDIIAVARRMQAEYAAGDANVRPSLPLGLVRVSAVAGSGVEHLRETLRDLLEQ